MEYVITDQVWFERTEKKNIFFTTFRIFLETPPTFIRPLRCKTCCSLKFGVKVVFYALMVRQGIEGPKNICTSCQTVAREPGSDNLLVIFKTS